MASFLRVIRQARWLKHPDWEWLSPCGIQSDALGDLQTRNNRLSVYRVESDEETEQVVVALAANRDNLANLDYALFDHSQLTETQFAICQEDGETPDLRVNKWHYDIRNLTVSKLVELASVVSSGCHVRVSKKEIEKLLRLAIRAGNLDKSRVNRGLLAKIE